MYWYKRSLIVNVDKFIRKKFAKNFIINRNITIIVVEMFYEVNQSV